MVKDLSRLKSWLNTSGLQSSNNPLYQTIKALIDRIELLQKTIDSISSGSSGTTIVNNPTNYIISELEGGNSNNEGEMGPPGIAGIRGIDGISGLSGQILFLYGDQGEDALSIPGPIGPQGPAGGGGGTVTRILLVLPFSAKREHKINIVDATVTATSKINSWLSGLAPEVVGSGDGVDMYNIQPIAKSGSFDLVMSFLTPFSGSLSIDYTVAA